jgi:replicative DNA helicase
MAEFFPHSKETEEAALSCVLINPDEYTTFALDPTDFYIHRHRMIWETIGALQKRGVNVDFVTLSDELLKRGQLGEVGGPAELARLTGTTPSGAP